MRRIGLIVLLSLGTLGGFASGIASMRGCHQRREAFEQHVARVCVDAAREAERDAANAKAPAAQQAAPVIVNVHPQAAAPVPTNPAPAAEEAR